MRAKYVGNKADKILFVVKNGETSASIPRGTPLVLKLSTTADTANDGLSVTLPATAGNANSYNYRYGVAIETFAAGAYSEAILSGMCAYTLVTRMTRAASTDSWTSSASIASGVQLGVDTLNNAFLIGASSAGSLPGVGAAQMVDSIASAAASASATSDARTAITASVRSFIRML